MKPISILSLVLIGLTLLSATSFAAPHPNIVLILADDMGFGDVAHLNPESVIRTPNLDRLAKEGMSFLDAHSPSGVCTPTRYGLLTGRYCWRSPLKRGVLGGYSPPLLEKSRPTIASMLRRQEYQTGAVGKWHLGMQLPVLVADAVRTEWAGDPGIDFSGVIIDSPIHHGFDQYFGVSASLDMAPYVYIRNDRFTKVPTMQQEAVKFPHFIREGPRSDDFVIDEVLDRLTQEGNRFIREASKKETPFFLYLPLTGPHKPTQPHKRFRGETPLGEYGDFVVQVDWTVGSILKTLDAINITKDTLVVFTSDNGSYMHRCDDLEKKDHVDDETIQGFRRDRHRANGRFRGTKADIWEAGHHVPFFIRWPGHVAAGSSSKTTISLTDLYATFSEITGADLIAGAAEDSFSLLKILEGRDAERGAPVIHHSSAGMFAIREGKLKLILGNGSGGRQVPRGKPFERPYQLFDLEADIEETTDLAAKEPGLVRRLSERLEAIRKSSEAYSDLN
jgi:arylsulfatase A